MAVKEARIKITAEDRTKRAFASAKQRVTGLTSAVFSMRGAMISAAGIAGMGLLIRRSIDAADSIGKMSDTIGISTDSLQELRFAADLAGISQASLDSSMAGFTKRVGEARSGTGTLITLLQKLDPVLLKNVQSARSTDEAFSLITEGAVQLTNKLDRAALLAAAFGRTAGTQMAVLLKDGTEGLNKLRLEAQELGIVMDEGLIRNAEKAKDDMTRLTSVLSVQFTAAVVELSPLISDVALSLVELAKQARIAFGDIGALSGDLLIKKLQDLDAERERTVARLAEADARAGDNSLLGTIKNAIRRDSESIQQDLDDVNRRISDAEIALGNFNTGQLGRLESPPTGSGAGDGGLSPVEQAKEAAKIAAAEREQVRLETALLTKVEAIRASNLTELELENQKALDKQFIIEESFQLGQISDAERKVQVEGLEAAHQKRLLAIQKKSLTEGQKFAALTNRAKVVSVIQTGASILQGVATSNKKLFKLQKVLALAEAAITLPSSVMKAIEKGGGLPWGAAFGALTLVDGLARIAAIKSASFSGGGGSGGGNVSPGGATPTFPADPLTGLPAGTNQQRPVTQAVTINVGEDSLLDKTGLRNLIEKINEAIDDGVQISSIQVA